MDKERKNRTGSNHDSGNEKKGDRKRTSQPGAQAKSNRQTKGHDEMHPERESGTKKGPNSI